ncbi:hypothetical protein PGB90_003761 [Kerria lacca]
MKISETQNRQQSNYFMSVTESITNGIQNLTNNSKMAIIVTDASDARYKEIKIMLDKMNYELLKLKAAVMKKYTKIEILGEFYDVSILKSEVTKENDSKITANIVVIKSGITSAVSLLYAK